MSGEWRDQLIEVATEAIADAEQEFIDTAVDNAGAGALNRFLAAAVIDALGIELAGYDTFRGVHADPIMSSDPPLFSFGVLSPPVEGAGE